MVGGIGQRVSLDFFSNFKFVRSSGFFGEPVNHVITIRGQILVSRTGDDPLHTMCGFKTPPCVRSKRPRVCRHHAHMPGSSTCGQTHV